MVNGLVVSSLLVGAAASFSATRKQPVLYEISTRPWLYSLAESGLAANCGQYVCLRDVPLSEWQRIADDSVDMVWLMGVWQLGEFGLQHDRVPAMLDGFKNELPDVTADDVIGSPYAVQQYTFNTDIGTSADLAAVRKTLHQLGMQLMLDFVPNHGAVDSVLVNSTPSVFMQKPSSYSSHSDWWIERDGKTFSYGRGPYDGPWTDTLQYNYWSTSTIEVMTKTLEFIASQADAIRCDMGMLLLNEVIERTWGDVMSANGFSRPSEEFWKVAIDAVRKQYPDTVFMAEAYNYDMTSPPEKTFLQNLGFDVVYDKTVLDDLKTGDLDTLRTYIGSQSQGFFQATAHFVENHDEHRSAENLKGQQQAFAGSVVASTIPGVKLFYFGQFDGFAKKLDVQLRRATKESPNLTLHKQYTDLLRLLKDEVFHSGSWTFISTPKDDSAWRLSAWRWASADGHTKRLIVVNYSDQQGWAKVQVADAWGNSGMDQLEVTELLTGAKYERSANEMRSSGLNCGLAPWTVQMFAYGTSTSQDLAMIV